jgi:hypothetical protein
VLNGRDEEEDHETTQEKKIAGGVILVGEATSNRFIVTAAGVG